MEKWWLKAPENGWQLNTSHRLMQIPEEPKRLMKMLMDAGYEAFVVGGCVRDSLIGRTPHDWDICTNALPDQMKEVFSDFRVLDTGLKHGTLTVLLENPYEITTYRKDGDYSDHRHPDQVEFVSDLKEDLSRRDFTMNAMAANINGEIIDYFDGQYDLLNRKIVCVGDPEQRFEEDALRILRAMRFSARYHFGIERKTANAMLAKRNLLLDIAAERIGNEFLQIMSGRCDWLLENFTEIFEVIIPEITPSIGFVQNNPHHCYDVWEHTVEAIRNCHGDTIVKIACLYHDFGKPFCYSEDENGIGHFYGHAAKSAEIAEQSLRNLRLESKLIADVVQLVASHDRVLEVKKNVVRRCLNKFGEIQFMNLIFLQAADKSAQRIDIGQRGEQVTRVSQFYRMIQEIKQDEDCFSLKDLAVNGNDLMQIGFVAGKPLGNALNQLLEMVMDDKIENNKENTALKAYKDYFTDCYGQGYEVANYHLNGDLEPLDTFLDSAEAEYESVLSQNGSNEVKVPKGDGDG